jgi:hypothetical protein
MLSSERFKGIQNNFTFSPSHTENQSSSNQIAVMGYMNEKIKYLEIENNELKKEISMKSSDKEKMDYYLRLRRDLLEELERNKNERSALEIKHNTEIQKLQEEMNSLASKFKLQSARSDEEFLQSERSIKQDNFVSTNNFNASTKVSGKFGAGSSKYFQNILSEEINSNFPDDNFNLYPHMSSGVNLNLFGSTNKKVSSKEEEKESSPKNINTMFSSTLMPNSGMNISQQEDNLKNESIQNLNVNPFLPIIADLEDRIKLLETALEKKNEECEILSYGSSKNRTENVSEIERLMKEIESWKQKYVLALSSKKSLSQEFQELYETQSENYRKNSEKTIYELEKKIHIIEKMNDKYEEDFQKLSKISAETENTRHSEIEGLKAYCRSIINEYEQLYKQYEENLKTLTKQIDSMRQLYSARETEFINITSYYTETIKEYSKAITDINNPPNVKILEDNFATQSKELEELRIKTESLIKELGDIRLEYLEARPKMRQSVQGAMDNYEKNISNIMDHHNNLESKLDRIYEFVEFFDTKFQFFNSLLEDNKKAQEKISQLECDLKMIDLESREKQMFELREEISKLQREVEIKNNLISQYEVELPRYQEQVNSSQRNSKKMKENAPDETVFKLKTEIALLKNQIAGLTKGKDGIEKFYQVELRNMMNKINEKNEKIEELLSIIRKLENDFRGKKETTFNLWTLEFKEFKESLITISDIKILIEKFKVMGEELNAHKDRVYSEELYLLRQEVKGKDDFSSIMKNNFESDRKNLEDLIAHYKNTIDEKIKAYDMLQNQKKLELNGLVYEKNRLESIHNEKKNVKINYLNFF